MTTDLEEQVRRAFREAPVPTPDPVRAARVRDGARTRRRRRGFGALTAAAAAALAVASAVVLVHDLRPATGEVGAASGPGLHTRGPLPGTDGKGRPLTAMLTAGDHGLPGQVLTFVPRDLDLSVSFVCTGDRALSAVVLVNGNRRFATGQDCGGPQGQRSWTYTPGAASWAAVGAAPGRSLTIEAVLVKRGTFARADGPQPVTGGVGTTRLSLGLYGAAGRTSPPQALPALPMPRLQSGGELLSGDSRPLDPANRTFSFVVVPTTGWVSFEAGCSALKGDRDVVVTVALDGAPRLETTCGPNPSYRSSRPVDMASSPTRVTPGRPITVTVTTGVTTSTTIPPTDVTPLDKPVPDGVVIAAAYPTRARG